MIESTGAQRRRAFGAWLVVCVFWSTTYLAIRIGVRDLPAFGMISGTRYIVAGLILAIIVRSRGVPLPSRDSWPGHALLGFLMLGVGNGALVWAEKTVPSGMAAVMSAMLPFWMIGVEACIPHGERIRVRQFVGLVLGFAGLTLLATADPGGRTVPPRALLLGALAIQLSGFGWSLGSAYSKRHARHENAFAAAAVQMVLGGLISVAASVVFGEWHNVHFTARGLAAWGYLIVFGALVGYAAYTYALKYLPVAIVSLYAYITPVLAMILGSVVLGEPFTARMAVASAIIFAGMLLVRQRVGTSGS